MEKECKTCHKKFKTYPSQQRKFCSRPCFRISRRKPPVIKICLYCKKIYTQSKTNQDQKFCSIECSNHSRDKRTVGYCLICKKTFKIDNTQKKMGWGKYCGRTCRNLGDSFVKKGVRLVKYIRKQCWVCSKEFEVPPCKSKYNYCSSNCCKKRWSEAFKECVECHSNKFKHKSYGYCIKCFYKSVYSKIKEGKRRAACRDSDITAKFLRDLWNRTDVCPLCGLQMEDNTSWPWGRHLDHIIPLHPKDKTIPKGTHTKDNMQYIHSVCNVNKGCLTLQKFSPKKITEIQGRYLHLYHRRGTTP